MRRITIGRTAVAAFLVAAAVPAAAETRVQVIIASDVRPGVYGRVELGPAPPPPLLYERPVFALPPPPAMRRPEPVYLHVPPGHAKNWSKHCHKYDACGRPVYFVRSAEYDAPKPKKPKKEKKDKRD
jgi:hypothetical protein